MIETALFLKILASFIGVFVLFFASIIGFFVKPYFTVVKKLEITLAEIKVFLKAHEISCVEKHKIVDIRLDCHKSDIKYNTKEITNLKIEKKWKK